MTKGTLSIVVVGLFVLGGCVLVPRSEPVQSDPQRDFESYHVRLIRPGMTLEEADRIVTFLDRRTKVGALSASAFGTRCGIVIEFTLDGKVIESQADIQVIFVHDKLADENTECLNRLRYGMSPAEVEQHIGAPKYGFENVPGTVVLLYDSQPGLEIVYVQNKVDRWRRTRTYLQKELEPPVPAAGNTVSPTRPGNSR